MAWLMLVGMGYDMNMAVTAPRVKNALSLGLQTTGRP